VCVDWVNWAANRWSGPQPAGAPGSGKAGARGTGADGAPEILTKLGIVLTDTRHRLGDCASNTGSGTLGRRRRSSTTTSQAECAGISCPVGVAKSEAQS